MGPSCVLLVLQFILCEVHELAGDGRYGEQRGTCPYIRWNA